MFHIATREHEKNPASGLLLFFASKRAGLRFEAVFHDFSVKGAPADVEEPGGFLLVPGGAFEHAHDVRTLGLSQRWHTRRRVGGDRCLWVKELDIRISDHPARS